MEEENWGNPEGKKRSAHDDIRDFKYKRRTQNRGQYGQMMGRPRVPPHESLIPPVGVGQPYTQDGQFYVMPDVQKCDFPELVHVVTTNHTYTAEKVLTRLVEHAHKPQHIRVIGFDTEGQDKEHPMMAISGPDTVLLWKTTREIALNSKYLQGVFRRQSLCISGSDVGGKRQERLP
jgi:hypothetical protein